VHALRHVHELLVPAGTLVDIHPVTEEHVEAAGELLGVIAEPEWLNRDLPNSEAALRQAIAGRLYELEAHTEYDVLQHFDHPGELLEAKRDLLETQHRLIDAITAAPPPLVTRMRVVFRRLRALATA
jgi:hypothetical protein